MKNIKLISFVVITFFVGIVGCSDFDDLNIDPNNPTSADPSTLLSRAQFVLFNTLHDMPMNAGFGMLMVQHLAENEYTEDSRYNQDQTFFEGVWAGMYTEVLKELSTAYDFIESSELADAVKTNQMNIIDVMQVYTYMFLSDSWGDVPYSTAINDEYDLPSYDTQEDIYTDLMGRLASAAGSFNENAASFSSGDLIYNGNISSWKKFTHSLLFRMAMRVSEKSPGLANQYLSTAASNLITNAADNALFRFDGDPAYSNPLWVNAVLGNRDDYSVSEILVNTLKDRNDPRLTVYAKESASGGYIGMPFGISDNDATVLNPGTSRPNDRVRSATEPMMIITNSEMYFLLAEAYERGLLTGDAENAYEMAITASMNYWGISDTDAINVYISQANVRYDSSNWKQSIGMQKWLALYTCGVEAWSEHRRLDAPTLPVPSLAALNAIPVSLSYPTSEISNNSESLGAVTSEPTSYSNRVWWDVN